MAAQLHPRDKVLTVGQLAAALQVSVDTIERSDLPCFYLGTRTKRFVWGTVLDHLQGKVA